MKVLPLDKSYIFKGKIYAVGETDVPDEMAKNLGLGSVVEPPVEIPAETSEKSSKKV
jgi:hypothetical protein